MFLFQRRRNLVIEENDVTTVLSEINRHQGFLAMIEKSLRAADGQRNRQNGLFSSTRLRKNGDS